MPYKQSWNWQQSDWPQFRYDSSQLDKLEAEFLRNSCVFAGAVMHVADEDRQQLVIELMGDEAANSAEIEGEILNRESLQSSIRRQFGLATDNRRIPPAEQGMAQIMVELYRDFSAPLTGDLICRWHGMLMSGRSDLKRIGCYRSGDDPMQVVSGPLDAPRVHFEAPLSKAIPKEMKRFMQWFASTAPTGKSPLPILTRAGIAHLYFVCVHPFEDGNGRMGRAIAEKAISESLSQPILIALSQSINRSRKSYYDSLERNNKGTEITDWLVYFAKTILEAQAHAQTMVEFIISKTKFFDRHRGQFNERQEKVVARMMREGPEGFKGGLSAENYLRITGTSRATATRDLQDLVEKKAFVRTGTLKGTRYHLAIMEKE